MSENLREYRRGLALYVLAHAKAEMSAAEIAEAMGEMSMNEGHPRACWSTIDTQTAVGVLQSLRNAGLVGHGADARRDKRNGRDAPTWRYVLGAVAAKRVQMPEPPTQSPAAIAMAAQVPAAKPDAAPAEYAGMTRQQLYAVLEVSDLYTTACAQFMQQMHDLNGRARRILASAGLGDLTGEPH